MDEASAQHRQIHQVAQPSSRPVRVPARRPVSGLSPEFPWASPASLATDSGVCATVDKRSPLQDAINFSSFAIAALYGLSPRALAWSKRDAPFGDNGAPPCDGSRGTVAVTYCDLLGRGGRRRRTRPRFCRRDFSTSVTYPAFLPVFRQPCARLAQHSCWHIPESRLRRRK